nr:MULTISPECIES: MucBP domain-containing protein [Enterococcus]
MSVCQPGLVLAETINSSIPQTSDTSKEAVEESSEEAFLSDSVQSSATIEKTELSDSQESIDFTVSQDNSSTRDASERDSATTNIASGSFGTSDWSIDDAGVLHIQPGEFADSPKNSNGTYQSPWMDYGTLINKIVFEGPVVASAIMDRLFERFSNVTEIENISYLDTSNTVNMQRVFAECSKLVSLDLTSWDTSNVQDIFSLFNGCVNLETLDVSTWNTQNMTSITYAFSSMAKLKVLDLSNWKLTPVNAAQGVFMGDSSLESLDLTGFNMTRLDANSIYATALFFQNASALKELKLSSNFRFIGRNASTNPELPMIPENDMYTGMWQNIGDGTITNPKGADIWTSKDLMSNFDFAPKNDTYVWQPVNRIAADVTVTYVDEAGEEIHTAQTIGGNIGDPYDATSPDYKLAIDGYTLDETNLPENATGTLGADAQTVVYKYTKDLVKAADVTVTYVDEAGEEIHTAQTIGGNIGDPYDATSPDYKLAIEGYTLDESKLPEHMIGVLSDQPQKVEYVYTKNPSEMATITINYVDETGKKIHDSKVISGRIGALYDVSTATYKLTIDGYTLNENKLPENLKGTFEKQNQIITYVYNKNNLTQNNPKPTNTKDQLPLAGEDNKKSLMLIGAGIILLSGTLYFVKKRKQQNS